MNNSYYNVSHSRDYYKGKSVEFAGEWTPGVRYFNDEYLNSLVVYTEKDTTGNIIHSALLACKKTHIAAYSSSTSDSTNNQPHLIINDDLGIVGIEPNDYWIFVSGSLMGTPGIPGKSTEVVNTYLEAVALADENNISKIVFVKEEKGIYIITGVGELKKVVSTSDLLELAESKVDKELGKGLSTNDFSNTEKAKLKEIDERAQRNVIEEVDLNGVKIDPIDKKVSINTVGSINDQTGDITLRDNSENAWDVNLQMEDHQIQGKVVTPKSVGSATTPVYFNENGEVTPINIDDEVTKNSTKLVTSKAIYEKLELKQDQLIPGDNITIQDNVISAAGNVDLSEYAKTEDVNEKLNTKQDTLIPGNGINIEDNKIDVTVITESETQPDTSIWVNPTEDVEVELTYNRSQIDALVGSKQDTIDDLDDIRSGASKGTTALQSETDPVYMADKPSLATKTELSTMQSTISDNLSLVNQSLDEIKQSENDRVTNEAERIAAEAQRKVNESERDMQEQTRQQQEAQRQQQEAQRQQEFQSAEQSRQATFAASESARDADFQSKEAERDAAMQTISQEAQKLTELQTDVTNHGTFINDISNKTNYALNISKLSYRIGTSDKIYLKSLDLQDGYIYNNGFNEDSRYKYIIINYNSGDIAFFGNITTANGNVVTLISDTGEYTVIKNFEKIGKKIDGNSIAEGTIAVAISFFVSNVNIETSGFLLNSEIKDTFDIQESLISLCSRTGVGYHMPFSSIKGFKDGYYTKQGFNFDERYKYIKIPYVSGNLRFYGNVIKTGGVVVAVDAESNYYSIRNWSNIKSIIKESEIPAGTIEIIISLPIDLDFTSSGILLSDKKDITFEYVHSFEVPNWTNLVPSNTEYNERTISNGNWGILSGTNSIINLDNDILIGTNTDGSLCSGTFNNANIIINGNGHNIFLANTKYNTAGFSNGLRYCELEESFSLSISTWFIAKGFNSIKALPLSISPLYRMKSFTYNKDTNEVEIILPDELKDISITEDENVYTSFSLWFYKVYGKVSSCSDGILKFINVGKRFSDDAMSYTGNGVYFRLINYKYYGNGVIVKGTKVYFPSCFTTLYKQYNGDMDVILNNTNSYLEINNATIYGKVHNVGGELKINNCVFPTPHVICISNENGGTLEVYNCKFNYNGCSIYNSANAKVEGNRFIGHGINMTSHVGNYSNAINPAVESKIEGNTIIENNIFVDCISCISSGNSESIKKDLHLCGDTIIKGNEIRFTAQYYINGYDHKLIADSGLIYIGTVNKNTVVTNNVLIGGNTNKSCHGIFMDDGAFNVTVAENIISNPKNKDTELGYSIDSRYESHFDSISYLPTGAKPCTNNKVYHNYADSPLRLHVNPNIETNGCEFAENVVFGISEYGNAIAKNNYIGEALFDCYDGFIDANGCVRF